MTVFLCILGGVTWIAIGAASGILSCEIAGDDVTLKKLVFYAVMGLITFSGAIGYLWSLCPNPVIIKGRKREGR